MHFPFKAPKRVYEKWERQNPIFDRETQFTKEEDSLLLSSINDLIVKKGVKQDEKSESLSSSSWTTFLLDYE